MSVGMRAYVRELATRLPKVAPDLEFALWTRGSNFGWDEQVRLPLTAWRSHAPLVHHMSVYAPLLGMRPSIVTIHDLIHLRYPQYFKSSVAPYYATVVRAVCARAARVITDDPRTVEDLQRFLGVNPTKVRTIPLGVDDVFLRDDPPAEPPPRPYFFYAGNHREHKDLATLAAAWSRLPEALEADLVLTGPDDVPSLSAASRTNGRVRFTGDVGSTRLAQLYRGAAAYVHPALCEGFGLPLLEAAACGTPVIGSRDAIPQVLAAVAQAYPPRDAGALSALLGETLTRPADPAFAATLRSTARAYTWDRCAAATAEVYREVVSERRGR